MFEQYIEKRRQRLIAGAAPHLEAGESIAAGALTETGVPSQVTGGVSGLGGFLLVAGLLGMFPIVMAIVGLLVVAVAMALSFTSTRQQFVAATERNLYVFKLPPLQPSKIVGVDEKHALGAAAVQASSSGLVIAGRSRRVTKPYKNQAAALVTVAHLAAAGQGAPGAPAAAPQQAGEPAGVGGQTPTEPGWYPDPWRQARVRYFDGQWTSHTAQ